jgi:hypothetical protein
VRALWTALIASTLALAALLVVDGGCSADCGAGRARCGSSGKCVDLTSSSDHCGSCGNVCPQGSVCSQSACVDVTGSSGGGPACPPGLTLCGQACAVTAVDPDNCGSCGTTCEPGQICKGGYCVSDCPPPETFCVDDAGAPYCAPTSSDPANCGACGRACESGQVCLGGGCMDADAGEPDAPAQVDTGAGN